MMSGIRARNTQPELALRRALHARGVRYRLHDPRLPGKPDLVLPRHRAVIQIHGCFWHGHGCRLFQYPQTRPEFWHAKITANQQRDEKVVSALRALGWRILVVWECTIREHPAPMLAARIIDWLGLGQDSAGGVSHYDELLVP